MILTALLRQITKIRKLVLVYLACINLLADVSVSLITVIFPGLGLPAASASWPLKIWKRLCALPDDYPTTV